MTVYGCQFDIKWEKKPENFKRVRSLLERSKILPGSLVVLPEMFATGFSMNARRIAESETGPTARLLSRLAKEKQAYVLGGLAQRGMGRRITNAALCFAPSGECVARYSKLHPFTPGGESKHYFAGKEIVQFRWAGLKTAVYICYDLRFPETFRLGTGRGVELIVVIANWPARRHLHWSTLLRARAIENQAYVIGVNRCGRDPQVDYRGGSVVIDPQGKILALAGSKQAVVEAELDPEAPARWRRDFPALQDTRTAIRLKSPRRISDD